MKVEYDVEVPNVSGRGKGNYCEATKALLAFYLSGKTSAAIYFDSLKEAFSKFGTLRSFCKRRDMPIRVIRRGSTIYLIKEEQSA